MLYLIDFQQLNNKKQPHHTLYNITKALPQKNFSFTVVIVQRPLQYWGVRFEQRITPTITLTVQQACCIYHLKFLSA